MLTKNTFSHLDRRVSRPDPIRVLGGTEANSQEERTLNMLAHAFFFATECDFFVADFSRTFSRFVYLLQTQARFTSNLVVPYYDLSGNHFEEEFSELDE
jgi:hypothetical protein